MSENLVDKTVWEKLFRNDGFQKPSSGHSISKWINGAVKKSEGATCIEIGCYPGRFLTIFGDLGYQLNGIDMLDGVDDSIPAWLNGEGYKTGEFFKADFLEHDFGNRQYDIVYSLGFIEHFINWEKVFQQHCNLVKKGGMILIECPNFKGWIQYLLHKVFDNDNFKKHNLKAMDLEAWENILNKNDFKIVYKGFFYGFNFWAEEQKRTKFEKAILKLLMGSLPLLRKILRYNSSSYSPFMGVIAVKNS